MAEIILNSENASVRISDIGAEPVSFFSDNREWIYQGADHFWSGLAPVLFPNIGPFPNNIYVYQNREYNLECHGFARTSIFKAEKIRDNAARFVLCSDKQTRIQYPFEFTLTVLYTLSGNRLTTVYEIYNIDNKPMYFGVGSHMGFSLRYSKENYQLQFDKAEDGNYSVMSNDEQLNISLLICGKSLMLSDSYFTKGAVTFCGLKSSRITLNGLKDHTSIDVTFHDFPYLTIWSQVDAPFLCMEPWSYRSGHYCDSRKLDGQYGIAELAPGQKRKYTYTITCKSEE